MIRRNCLPLAGSVVAVMMLTACSTGQPRFSTMSGEELHSYNWNKPFAEQVTCQRLPTANSRIPRRKCFSNANWAAYLDRGFARVNMMRSSNRR